MKYGLILALLAQVALAAPPTTCGIAGDYASGLCAYQRGNFDEAEKALRPLAEGEHRSPETIRATYFLARTLMKTGRFEEASKLLIRIYALDRAFYDNWNCDFLLGECRKAQGM